MSAATPHLPASAHLLTELLAHTAAATGFRAARVLLATGTPAAVDSVVTRAGIITTHRDDPLVQYAQAADGPVEFPVRRLPETILAGHSSADVVLIHLSADPTAPLAEPGRVLALLGARTGSGYPGPQDGSALLNDLRVLLAAAVTAVLEAAAADRHRCALENARRLADARVTAEQRLDAASDASDPMAALVRLCAELSGKPAILFDPAGRIVTATGSGNRVGLPDPATILRAHGVTEPRRAAPVLLAAGTGTGLTRRKLLVPIVERGTHFGWLALDEYPAGFSGLDEYLVARTARRLGAQFLVQHRIARVAWSARSSLTRQLVRGTGAAEDLAAGGEYLGVDTRARRVLVYLLAPRHDVGDLDRALAQELEHRMGVEVLSTRGSEGILLLVEADAATAPATTVQRVKKELAAAAAAVPAARGLAAGVSGVSEPTALARAYREAREVAQCIDRFSTHGAHRILAVGDLGPARLFLANGPITAVRQFVDDTLGPLLHGDTAATELLRTLECWFGHGRSIRATATELGLHENTVRLRLARVHTMTGLDVAADPADQLSIQTALLVLRLRGGGPTSGEAGDGAATVSKTRPVVGVSGAAAHMEERRTA